MTDYFALLNQPRSPWVDQEQLKQAFHAKSLRAHPDAQTPQDAGTGQTAFTELNEGYKVLQDPKRRLQHLLALEGKSAESRFSSVPADIEELFPQVATLTHEAKSVTEQYANAGSPLTRSLLKPQLLTVQQRVSTMLDLLNRRNTEAVERLKDLGAMAKEDHDAALEEMHTLYVRFSYLNRWITELTENQLRLGGA